MTLGILRKDALDLLKFGLRNVLDGVCSHC